MKSLVLIAFLALAVLAAFAQEKSYTIIFLNSKPDAEKIDEETQKKLFEGHMDNIRRLSEEGKLLAAGPFDGGGGIFILNTPDAEVAEGWVATDPAVQANRWNIEILSYTPRIGSICPVKGDVDMVSYTFVRFDAIVDKFTAGSYPNIIRQHELYMKEVTNPDNVVTEAIFGPNDGGILILKGDLAADAFAQDPGVQQGLLDVRIRKLYIAKSSFCEK